jgi:hypothetical protein
LSPSIVAIDDEDYCPPSFTAAAGEVVDEVPPIKCTSGIHICFVILLDGVILDETMVDQVRLHHVIFLEKLVLAAIGWINGALSA